MKFWKTMTVWQMEELLRAREQPGIKEGWQQLTDKLHMLESSSGMTGSGVLGDCPRAPAVYFFTIVLAICGRYADAGALKRAMDRYLPDIYSAGYNEPDNQYCLRVAYYRQELNACLQYIMQAAEAYTPETLLKDLLAGINSRHLEAGGVARSMERGIITFRVNLNAWSRTCKAMWSISRSQAAQEVCGRIENGVKQIILTGAPGTGKTYAAKQIAQCMGEEYQLVQFHPSYDYTDFVEGLRPVQLEEHQNGSFVRLDGTFKAFCREVAQKEEAGKRYFFLIDEINRANLSQVLGELMYCLEADKRGKDNRVQTQYRNLETYLPGKGWLAGEEDIFHDGFYIPKNVIIIGTMNDIDRSVESFDFALRRRFEWKEIRVTQELLLSAFEGGGFDGVLCDEAEAAVARIMGLNDVLASLPEADRRGEHSGLGEKMGLNRQYYISQGQFANLPRDKAEGDLEELMKYVWKYRVEPLLREYVRGEDETDVEELIGACGEALGIPEPQGV